jgi:hypothetical protein
LVYFVAIWYILPFWYFVPRKNLATLIGISETVTRILATWSSSTSTRLPWHHVLTYVILFLYLPTSIDTYFHRYCKHTKCFIFYCLAKLNKWRNIRPICSPCWLGTLWAVHSMDAYDGRY